MKESLPDDFLSKKVESFIGLTDLTTTRIHDIQDDKEALLRLEEIKIRSHRNAETS